MASVLNPYIGFPGTAKEALEFYQSVFGGELTLNTFGQFGAADAPDADKIMHGLLKTGGGLTLMASDHTEGMDHSPGNNISLSLSGDDADDLHDWWDKLSADGVVSMPLAKQMWGDEFGMCIDKFAISWMVNITSTRS